MLVCFSAIPEVKETPVTRVLQTSTSIPQRLSASTHMEAPGESTPAEQAASPSTAADPATTTPASPLLRSSGVLALSCHDDAEAAADEQQHQQSRPASPLNIHGMLNRPFGDVMREIMSGFQLKSTSQVAAEQLRYLMFHRDHDREVLGSPALMAQLHQQVREAPGLPAAGSCMAVLAQLARTAAGRAQLRAEGVLQPVLRFLAMPDVLLKGNAEPALLLLQNLSCEKLCRHSIIKSGGVELLLQLLAGSSLVLKQQHPKLVSYLTGTLLNLVTGDGEGSPAKQLFAKAGGMEAGCKVLADWGRYDSSPATLRLRLLLADLGKLQQFAARLQKTALDASTSARSGAVEQPAAGAGPGSARMSAAGGQQPANLAVSLSPDVVAMAGLGIPLGTPRMPASERITAVVLQHGKAMHDAAVDEGSDEQQGGSGGGT